MRWLLCSEKFGIESLFVTTMQAVSGAGYPGVASLDILGNVIPYIAKEEEKMEEETRKLLGRLNGGHIEPASFTMTAHCNRVAVEDGHTESVSVKLQQESERRGNHRCLQRISIRRRSSSSCRWRRRSRSFTTMPRTVRSRAWMWTAATA